MMEFLVVHGGGPSATLNAGLAGLLDACRDEGEAIRIWGARRGLDGALSGDWADLSAISPAKLETVMRTPGSAIGASRRRLDDEEARNLLAVLSRCGAAAVVLSGGNGSMGAASRLAKAAEEGKTGLKVVGLPNAAANDVTCTDHAPGFGSAARFHALALRDLSEDDRALPAPVTVIEALGRNTGWLAAATGLARSAEDEGPHLVYLPEQPAELEQIVEDARTAVARWGRALIVGGEGLGDDGELARRIQAATGLQTRSEPLGALSRSCSWALSETDVEESYRCGRAAAEAVLGGASGVMIALRRRPGAGYSSFPLAVPFSDNPARERRMPAEWVGAPGAGATQAYFEWLQPLVGDIPPVERIV